MGLGWSAHAWGKQHTVPSDCSTVTKRSSTFFLFFRMDNFQLSFVNSARISFLHETPSWVEQLNRKVENFFLGGCISFRISFLEH